MPQTPKYLKLTGEERKTLAIEIQNALKMQDYKKRRRLQIPYLSDQGCSYRAIMQATQYGYSTVRYWLYRYKKEGLKAFLKHWN